MIKEEVKDDQNELIYFVDDVVLNDNQYQIFVPSNSGNNIWHRTSPDYEGRVGQAVLDLGITLITHTQASLNETKSVGTVKVVREVQSLALSVKDKVTIIKTAGQSKAIYGAAVDQFAQAEINTLRGRYTQALWPNKYTACRTT
eukprot:11327215-Heterocapsa_arctica.AAC.1